MRNGLAPSHQQFKPTARRTSIARQVSVTAFLARETVFNLVRAPQRTVLDPDNRPLINRLGCEVAYRDSLSGQYSLVARIPVCRVDGFLGHVAGIVMILPRLLFARASTPVTSPVPLRSLQPKRLTKELALDFHRSMDLRTGQAAQCLSTANYNMEHHCHNISTQKL